MDSFNWRVLEEVGQEMLRANIDFCQEVLKCSAMLMDLLTTQGQRITMKVRDFIFSCYKQTWKWRGNEPMALAKSQSQI